MHARSLIRIINCHALKQIAQHGNKLKRMEIRTDLERIRNGSKTDNEILLNGNGTTRSIPFRFIKRQREVFFGAYRRSHNNVRASTPWHYVPGKSNPTIPPSPPSQHHLTFSLSTCTVAPTSCCSALYCSSD